MPLIHLPDVIRRTIRTSDFNSFAGKLGVTIRMRTKVTRHGSRSRAFYTRIGVLAHILGLYIPDGSRSSRHLEAKWRAEPSVTDKEVG